MPVLPNFVPNPTTGDVTIQDAQAFNAENSRWNVEEDVHTNYKVGIPGQQPDLEIASLANKPPAWHHIRFTASFRTASNSVVRFRFSDNLTWFDFTNNTANFKGFVSWGTSGQQKPNWLDGTNATAQGVALAYIRGDQLCKAMKSQYLELDMLNFGNNRVLVTWNFHQHSDAGVLMNLHCKGLITYDLSKAKRLQIIADTNSVNMASLYAEWT